MQKEYYTYMLASKKQWVIYVWVTSDIIKRIYEHKQGVIEGFTKKYFVKNLVYYEIYSSVYDAIAREKQLKAGSRNKKIELIEKENKNWEDLYDTLV